MDNVYSYRRVYHTAYRYYTQYRTVSYCCTGYSGSSTNCQGKYIRICIRMYIYIRMY